MEPKWTKVNDSKWECKAEGHVATVERSLGRWQARVDGALRGEPERKISTAKLSASIHLVTVVLDARKVAKP